MILAQEIKTFSWWSKTQLKDNFSLKLQIVKVQKESDFKRENKRIKCIFRKSEKTKKMMINLLSPSLVKPGLKKLNLNFVTLLSLNRSTLTMTAMISLIFTPTTKLCLKKVWKVFARYLTGQNGLCSLGTFHLKLLPSLDLRISNYWTKCQCILQAKRIIQFLFTSTQKGTVQMRFCWTE